MSLTAFVETRKFEGAAAPIIKGMAKTIIDVSEW